MSHKPHGKGAAKHLVERLTGADSDEVAAEVTSPAHQKLAIAAAASHPTHLHERLLERATPVRIIAQPHDNVPIWLRTLAGWTWRTIVLIAGVVLIAYAALRVQEILIALFIAATVASVLRPLRNRLQRRMSRGKAVAVSMVIAFLVITSLLAFIVYSVVVNWESLSRQFTGGLDTMLTWLQNGPLHVNLPFDNVRGGIEQFHHYLSDHAGEIAGRATGSVGGVLRLMTTGALALFCTIFLLSSGNTMWQWVLEQVPVRQRATLATAFRAGWGTFAGYARGTVIIALLQGVISAVLLTVLRVPLSIPLAVLIAIGTAIPMIGGPAVMLIAAIVSLAASGPVHALIVLIAVALLGQLEGRVWEPLIYGKSTNLHPMVVAIAVTAGAMLFGLLGATLALPLVAMVWAIFKALRNESWADGGVSDEPYSDLDDLPDGVALAGDGRLATAVLDAADNRGADNTVAPDDFTEFP